MRHTRLAADLLPTMCVGGATARTPPSVRNAMPQLPAVSQCARPCDGGTDRPAQGSSPVIPREHRAHVRTRHPLRLSFGGHPEACHRIASARTRAANTLQVLGMPCHRPLARKSRSLADPGTSAMLPGTPKSGTTPKCGGLKSFGVAMELSCRCRPLGASSFARARPLRYSAARARSAKARARPWNDSVRTPARAAFAVCARIFSWRRSGRAGRRYRYQITPTV